MTDCKKCLTVATIFFLPVAAFFIRIEHRLTRIEADLRWLTSDRKISHIRKSNHVIKNANGSFAENLSLIKPSH